MSDDDEHIPLHATARPPPGEEDVYSASTVVGEASGEMLALIRAENAKAASPSSGLRPAPGEAIKTPVASPVPVPPPAEDSTVPASKATADADRNPERSTLHPAVGIVLFFVAVSVVLAALVR